MKETSKPVGLRARRGSNPFPGANLPFGTSCQVMLGKKAQFEPYW